MLAFAQVAPLFALVALIVFFPLASAGTEQAPEIRDPMGDQDPTLSTHSFGDILAVWFHDQSRKGMIITMKVASLASDTSAAYDVTWTETNPLSVVEEPRKTGVRVRIDAGRAEWRTLDVRPGANVLSENIKISGNLKVGTPGSIEWSLPREATQIRHQEVLQEMKAKSSELHPLSRQVYRTVDEASGGASRIEVLDFPTKIRFERMEPPTQKPIIADPTDSARALTDVEAVWLSFSDDTIEYVIRNRSVSLSEGEACSWTARVRTTDGGSADVGLNWYVTIDKSGWWVHDLAARVNGQPRNFTMVADPGGSGLLRFQIDQPTPIAQLGPSSSNLDLAMYCRESISTSNDEVRRQGVPLAVPALGPVVALVVLVAVLRTRSR